MPDIRTRNQPADITVGLRVPHELPGGAAGLRDFAARVEATGIDRLFIGDHVTFQGGQGFDGLINATAVAVSSRRSGRRPPSTCCRCAIPFRSPARSSRSRRSRRGGSASVSASAARTRRRCAPAASTRPPGAGGWTRRWPCCGRCWRATEVPARRFLRPGQVRIQPARGRRADRGRRPVRRRAASRGPVRRRLARSVGHPRPLRRRGRAIAKYAADEGRPVWGGSTPCTCGAVSADSATAARDRLAAAMEALYRTPYDKFARYSPAGRPPTSPPLCGGTSTRGAGRSTCSRSPTTTEQPSRVRPRCWRSYDERSRRHRHRWHPRHRRRRHRGADRRRHACGRGVRRQS